MRNLSSCQQRCVTNHIQVQLSVVALNGILDFYFTHQVIFNVINSWGYTNMKWDKPDIRKYIMSSCIIVFVITMHRIFLHAIARRAQNVINNFWIQLSWMLKNESTGFVIFTSLTLNIHISIQNSHLPTQKICDHIFRYLFWFYFISYHACPFFVCFEDRRVL